VSSGHDWFSGAYAEAIATHYETLGVRPDATAAEIRAAYLTRARQQHPDVSGPVAATSAAMVELNHAYQVLRRDHTRAEYDRQLGRPTSPRTAEPADPPYGFDDEGEPIPPSPGSRAATRILSPGGPARMPWKLMGVAAVLGSIVILVSAAFVQSPKDELPDGILRVGSCVAVEPNNDVREVACGPDAELVVRLVIPSGWWH
jgi:molecular chaperone DnaJ